MAQGSRRMVLITFRPLIFLLRKTARIEADDDMYQDATHRPDKGSDENLEERGVCQDISIVLEANHAEIGVQESSLVGEGEKEPVGHRVEREYHEARMARADVEVGDSLLPLPVTEEDAMAE